MVSVGLGLVPGFSTGREEMAHSHHELCLRILGEQEAEGPSQHRGPAIRVLKVFKTTESPAGA